MTEIALIADIHGNIPALTAVDEDIKRRGISTVYCLGDMCGRGPNGSAAIDYCRDNCDVILMGNWDEHVATGRRPDYLKEAGAERQAFLRTLPLYHKMWLSGRRIHLFHGRPLFRDIVWEDSPAEKKLSLFSLIEDEYPVDIVGYADIHRQFKTDFKDDYRILFNTGSVGNSFCTPTACYAILRGELGSREKAPISIEFVSVPYDNAQAVANMRKELDWFDFPDEYTAEVTLGRWQPNL
ncbi:MAG: metallophosphoesterase [Oscillospiraceae bacterium]|nr:metallophosphoesterase [Oscillospiraceae bacterium]